MSRFDDSASRLRRVLARNEGRLVSGIAREAVSLMYRKPWFRRLAGAVAPVREPAQWVFIVGCYNSGTSILRRLLDAHPEVSTLPQEGVNMTDAFPDLEAGGWPRMMAANQALWALPEAGAAERVRRAKRDWAPFWKRGARIFVEKSIDHTTRIDWLRRHWTRPRFIVLRRDPLCVGEGIMRRARPTAADARIVDGRYPPALVGWQSRLFEAALVAETDGRDDCLAVRYEDLMADPVATLDAIFAFIGASPIAVTREGASVRIGDEAHEVVDQNPASLARLSLAERAALLEAFEQRTEMTAAGGPGGV